MTKNELPLWKEQLSAYLDNELSPADRRAFEEAMHRRPEIQREHDTLLALRSALKGLPATAPSADFFARAQKSGRATSRPWPLLFPSLIGAAAAALVMIVVSQDTRHRTDAPSLFRSDARSAR
jgi:anti-sigma factor RsiW